MSATVVKIGSSIVAHDDGTLREDVLARICDEVASNGYEGFVTEQAEQPQAAAS